MNGETKAAPAFAARSAWFAEKTSVVFTRMPSALTVLIACSPTSDIGIFTTTFGCHEATRRASSTSGSYSIEMHSAEMGPSTTSQISRPTPAGCARESVACLANTRRLSVSPACS